MIFKYQQLKIPTKQKMRRNTQHIFDKLVSSFTTSILFWIENLITKHTNHKSYWNSSKWCRESMNLVISSKEKIMVSCATWRTLYPMVMRVKEKSHLFSSLMNRICDSLIPSWDLQCRRVLTEKGWRMKWWRQIWCWKERKLMRRD